MRPSLQLAFFVYYFPLVLCQSSLLTNPSAPQQQPQCLFTDRWPQGPGQSLTPQPPDPELTQILSQIDPTRIQSTIQKLVSFGTRHTLSSQTDPTRGIGAARDWIAQQMRVFAEPSGGRMRVSVPSYLQQPDPGSSIPNATVISNVLATLEGDTDPGRVYVVSGHYDSRVSDLGNFWDDAPGADDDASGVAVSMELARVMATHRSAATIIFAAVAGEEQGLFGANFLAQQLQTAGADVQGMFTNDIVGSSTADDGTTDPFRIRLFAQGMPPTDTPAQAATRISIGGENDSPARQLGRFIAEVASNPITNMTVEVVYREDRFLRGGDHEPFLNRGFPAIRFTEPHENFAHQHQDVRVQSGEQFGDLVEFCDFDYVARVARVNGAAVWSLAQAPGMPRNVTVDTSVLTNNSTLGWVLDGAGDAGAAGTGGAGVQGYEIVWRATNSPFWTDVIDVGNVDKATVLLSKDNAVFGVRAVGQNGFRSPAVFPFPSVP